MLKVCLSPVMQAYGLTETCAGGTTQLPNQTDTETVGSVVPCCEIRLVDWPEAGYRCTDTPNPRGEIYIGGENVAIGYYNLPDKTQEDFKNINGVRYFATGDIGEFLPNGSLKIIDRKKDLIKLSGGEYISLNKVESVLKLLPLVDNCCVFADPFKSNCVCIVCPNVKKIIDYMSGEDFGFDKKELDELSEISSLNEKTKEVVNKIETNKKLSERLVKIISEHCAKQGLETFERPSKIKFVKDIWMPDTGLVTDSLKLKRKELENFYKVEIIQLYKS